MAQEQINSLAFVESPARLAIYDDMLSAPRILEVKPAPTREFLGNLSASIYEQSKNLGGTVPYTVIAQVSENFIHAGFSEMVVSVFDNGNTIRFSDQGPGIRDKEKAQQPGFSSATQEMKEFINGVGSGLPLVREYMETKNGDVCIEDNLESGSVVTISLVRKLSDDSSVNTSDEASANPTVSEVNSSSLVNRFHNSNESFNVSSNNKVETYQISDNERSLDILISSLSNRSRSILMLFESEKLWRVSSISDALGIAASSTHNELKKLEDYGLITHVGKQRALTDFGQSVLTRL